MKSKELEISLKQWKLVQNTKETSLGETKFYSYGEGDKKVSYQFDKDKDIVSSVNFGEQLYKKDNCIKVNFKTGKYHYKIHSFVHQPKNIIIKCLKYRPSSKDFWKWWRKTWRYKCKW